MKSRLFFTGAAIASLLVFGVNVAPADNVDTNSVRVVFDLQDGSRIVGQSRLQELQLNSEAIGKLHIPMTRISSITFAGTNQSAAVTLRNRDQMRGVVQVSGFETTTVYGNVMIPLMQIQHMQVSSSDGGGTEEGLVLHLSFDQDGTKILDESRNHHDGVPEGTRLFPNGHIGAARLFEGDGYIRVKSSAKLEPKEITVMAWVKGRGCPGSGCYVLSKGADACNGASYAFGSWPGKPLTFYINGRNDHAPHSAVAPTELWDDRWHHIVGTFDGQSVELYLDGRSVGPGRKTTIPIEYNLPTDNNLYIGTYIGCPNNFIGLIDEVKIYSRVLTGEEIAIAAEAGVNRATPPKD